MKMNTTRTIAAGLAVGLAAVTLAVAPASASAASSKGSVCNVDRRDYMIAADYHPTTRQWSYQTLNARQCTSRNFDADVVLAPTGRALRQSQRGRDLCDTQGIWVPGGHRSMYVTRGC